MISDFACNLLIHLHEILTIFFIKIYNPFDFFFFLFHSFWKIFIFAKIQFYEKKIYFFSHIHEYTCQVPLIYLFKWRVSEWNFLLENCEN